MPRYTLAQIPLNLTVGCPGGVLVASAGDRGIRLMRFDGSAPADFTVPNGEAFAANLSRALRREPPLSPTFPEPSPGA